VATEAVVNALRGVGEAVDVDLQGLSRARQLLDSFLVDERRALPKNGSPACVDCEYHAGEVCCGLR
jgi:hydroxymethylglutaryl-CoA lyase